MAGRLSGGQEPWPGWQADAVACAHAVDLRPAVRLGVPAHPDDAAVGRPQVAQSGDELMGRFMCNRCARIYDPQAARRSEEHTPERQSLMRNSYAVFRLKKKTRRKEYKDK